MKVAFQILSNIKNTIQKGQNLYTISQKEDDKAYQATLDIEEEREGILMIPILMIVMLKL